MGFRDRMTKCESSTFFLVIPGLFGVVAWFITIGSNFVCNSVKYQLKSDFDITDLPLNGTQLPDVDPGDLTMGLWSHRGWVYWRDYYGRYYLSEACVRYDDSIEQDALWITAQAFSIIAFVLGFFVMFGYCFAAGSDTDANTQRWLKIIGGLYVFIALCQGLTLLQLSSNFCTDNPVTKGLPVADLIYNQECVFSTGIKLNISAVALYFCAGVGCFMIRPPISDGNDDEGGYNDDDDDGDNKEEEKENTNEDAM